MPTICRRPPRRSVTRSPCGTARHWEGVTAALTARGMLAEEFENGYDWLHQGRSLLFFYGICAADPDDEAYRRRVVRFADMHLPDSLLGNYDTELRMMRAPHIGALGPNPGLGETVFPASTGGRTFARRTRPERWPAR
jgi:hypothetical protein